MHVYVGMYVMHVCRYVMDHVKCIRIKHARQFNPILEEVMKSEKAVRSCQITENNRLKLDGNCGAVSSRDI